MTQRRRFSHSLSGRLILIFVGVAVLFLLLVGGSIGRAFRAHVEATLRPHLLQYLDYVQADIGNPPDYGRAAELGRRLPVVIQITGPEGTWSSNGVPVDLGGMEVVRREQRAGKQYARGSLQGREYLRVQAAPYTYAYTIPLERGTGRMVIPLLVLLFILGLLYHATKRLFAPVQTIKAGVERLGRGELDHRVTVCRRDELGELAISINAMADDVQRMLDSKRQLLLAISHELRSPLTRAKVATGLLDDENQRMEIERELNDLEKLIEELLETERLATRHEGLRKQHTNLNELVREVIGALRTTKVRTIHLHAEVEAEVDQVRVKLLVRNLVENALRHTPESAAPPEIHLGTTSLPVDDSNTRVMSEYIEMTVRDHGPGIPAEHLPHVTDPFYRVDPARQRETGGYGLGLYLCRRIAEAHGGSLAVTSAPDGTTVRVFLPKVPPA